ncbi:hypothetical protein, partial [Taibaiella lutea]|uniref:hypothetical protein n=1 Tax=Taibaiella lutea TaxID=2608001 RepID=UPI001C124C60
GALSSPQRHQSAGGRWFEGKKREGVSVRDSSVNPFLEGNEPKKIETDSPAPCVAWGYARKTIVLS